MLYTYLQLSMYVCEYITYFKGEENHWVFNCLQSACHARLLLGWSDRKERRKQPRWLRIKSQKSELEAEVRNRTSWMFFCNGN